MSRCGYSEDIDPLALGRWRAQVKSATNGKRGQKLLVEMLVALDAMPEKTLIAEDLETEEGEVCALGALGKAHGINLLDLDPEEPEAVAAAFDVAPQLVREIAYMNDDWSHETPEQRWARMRAWVAAQIKEPTR